MNYDEKQIQEMAKCMCSSYESGKGCKTCPTNWCYADECATMAYCNNYRKVDKDNIVISKKEYERFRSIEIAFKEFAKPDGVLIPVEEHEELKAEIKRLDQKRLDLQVDNNMLYLQLDNKSKETAKDILNMLECFLWETAINDTKFFDLYQSLYKSIKEHIKNKYDVV